MINDKHPNVVFGRLLTCTKCKSRVDLIEIPSPWIDSNEYVCGECLQPAKATKNIPENIHGPMPEAPVRRLEAVA